MRLSIPTANCSAHHQCPHRQITKFLPRGLKQLNKNETRIEYDWIAFSAGNLHQIKGDITSLSQKDPKGP